MVTECRCASRDTAEENYRAWGWEGVTCKGDMWKRVEEILSPHRRAEENLLRHLTEPQQKSWAEYGWLVEEVGGRRYALNIHGRVAEHALSSPWEYELCIEAPPDLPAADRVLAILLMLRHDYAGFRHRLAPFCVCVTAAALDPIGGGERDNVHE